MNQQPPKHFVKLFGWFCEPSLLEELQGDLEEGFHENIAEYGLSKARTIYRIEVIKLIRPSALKHVKLINKNIMGLPKNYLKTSLRAIKLHPFYVFANVFGLALALSICTIGYFNYRSNKTFNTHFKEAENLFKIHGERIGESTLGSSSMALGPALRSNGIEAMRYTIKSLSLKDGNRLFSANIAFVDPAFMDHFPSESLKNGSVKPPSGNEILISKKLALKLFNEVYPVGQLVKIVLPNQKEESFTVADVFEELPTNTSFWHSAMLSMDTYLDAFDIDPNDWSGKVDGTFVYAEKQTLDQIETLLTSLIPIRNENNPALVISNYHLDNILEWPAFENALYNGEFNHHLHPSAVMGIAGSALSILLLACFNFINTSIALSGKRLKEIAVRKVMGGNRKSTISQFMIENSFLIFLAVLLSIVLSHFLIPQYNALFEQEIIQLENVPFLVFIQFGLVLILVVTLLSASYPSLYVSRFSPLLIFRKRVVLTGKNRLMTVLLTFQFALCFYNIFGIFLNVDNSHYQETLDRGYDVDPIVNVLLNRPDQYQVLSDYLEQSPLVKGIAGSTRLIGFSREQQLLNFEGDRYPVSIIRAGEKYPEMMGLRLIKGSFNDQLGQHNYKVIINRLLERQFGEDLLNKVIIVGDQKYTVIGVVEDFNVRNIMMDNKIAPTVIQFVPEEQYRYAVAKVTGSPEDANRELEKIWYQVFPQELYRGFLQKEVMQSMRETNDVMIKINSIITVITILISILGLYTLISLKVQRRSKEFGVRKVLGASRGVVIHLLSKELYWILGIAALVGLTGSTMILGLVFDTIYAYHISPEVGHFIKSTLIVLSIVTITIGYKVYQTSNMNPAEQLRTE